jgi:hypothetical protein
MNIKSFFDNPEELFMGAVLQFPIYYVVGWWVLPIMLACGLLWRFGGAAGGNKLARRLGVPGLVCGATLIATGGWVILLAIPFMVWLAPSYGKDSFLFKFLKDDFLTRVITYAWYWIAFAIAYLFT